MERPVAGLHFESDSTRLKTSPRRKHVVGILLVLAAIATGITAGAKQGEILDSLRVELLAGWRRETAQALDDPTNLKPHLTHYSKVQIHGAGENAEEQNHMNQTRGQVSVTDGPGIGHEVGKVRVGDIVWNVVLDSKWRIASARCKDMEGLVLKDPTKRIPEFCSFNSDFALKAN